MPRNYDKAAFTDLPAAYDKDTPIEENYGSDANNGRADCDMIAIR